MVSVFVRSLLSAAAQNASQIAIVDRDGERKTTYSQLFGLSRKIVSFISAQGILPGSFILVRLPACMEYIACEVGIWLSGCIVVPVNSNDPQQRILNNISAHCNPSLVIDMAMIERIVQCDAADGVIPQDTDGAMLIYTSGSTGKPKAVLHTFKTFDTDVPRTLVPSMDMSGVVFGTAAPLYFAASNWLYDVLIAGGTVHLYSEQTKKDVRRLEDYIEANNITVSHISPAVLKLFHNKSKSLKVVMTAGEKLTTQCSKDGYRLFNMFGQTEVMLNIFYFEVPDHAIERVPLGRPMHGIEFAILDEEGRKLENGQTGELCVKGNFCKGYYKDDPGTRELYEGGWLHTKDLAFVDEDGLVQYVNRKDWMVKINGQRVEPGEVEHAMTAIEGIEAAIVKGFTDRTSGSNYLVGYYILSKGCSVTQDQIRDSLSKCLSPYMIPRFFRRIDAIPLNANGKLDRNALPRVDMEDNAAEYAEPVSLVEKELCDAFARILTLTRAGLDDDFFLLGGDSIKVMSLTLACPRLNLSLDDVYEGRTPRKIAQLLESRTEDLETVADGVAVPLSRMQVGIYYECIRSNWKMLYNNAFLFKFGEGIDMQRLRDAVQMAVKAHPILFAEIFISQEGTVKMKKRASENYCLAVENVSDSAMEILRESMEDLEVELLQPASVGESNLFKIRLFQTPTRKFMFCDFHHIIFDGTSMRIFMEAVDAGYRGNLPVAERASGFDFALAEYKARKSEAYEKAKQWYETTFAEMDAVSLPSPVVKLPDIAYDAVDLSLEISSDVVEQWCRLNGVTPNVLTTGAFGYLLASYTADSKCGFVTIYNGRKDARAANTVGMLVKAMPVYCKLDSENHVLSYLKAVQDQLMGSMANDIYSFSDFATEKSLESDVIFTYQGSIFDIPSIAGEKVTGEKLSFNATGEILSVDVFVQDGHLELRIEFRSDLYDKPYIQRMCECYRNALHSMMNAEYIGEVSLLDDAMRQSVAAISTGEVHEVISCTFVGFFKAAAAKYPDNVAVVDKGSSYTYAQLDMASDALASKLISDGVQNGDFVSVTMGRQKEFVAAAIGIMKAGAAYVPIDTEYPEQRRRFMTEDSGARITVDEKYFDGISASVSSIDRSVLEGPAYMIYTSGSTGTPKGVVIHHSALGSFTQSIARLWRLTSSSRISCHSSFSFDASVEDLFPALTVGGSVFIMPEEIRKDISALHSYIIENGITGGCYTTQLGVSLLEFYPDLPVDYLVVGGEYLASRPDCSCRFINTYGPTEFTVDATWTELSDKCADEVIPIGKPMPGCSAWIVDRMGGLLPQGIVGEICLGGAQIAAGYWNRPELTESIFREERFLPGIKLYHTGDLGRYNANGDLEYCGRIDNQVKIRGFRVEMGEIDSAVMKVEGVRSCVSAVREAGGRDTLCTWYVADKDVSPDDIRAKIASFLPDYMVPDMIIRVDSFCYLPSGKVNVSSLSLFDKSLPERKYVAPENERERVLVDILTSITQMESIGTDDDLIKDCGLSSLQLIKFIYLAEQQGVVFSMSDVFAHRTVAELTKISKSPFYEFIESEDREGAPFIICVCGYVPYHPYYDHNVKYMRKDWSLLLFDEIFNNIGNRKVSIDELLDDYIPVIRNTMKKRKPAFVMGICYGADIAFALVNRIRDELGVELPLMAFEPMYDRNIMTGIPEEIKGNESLVKKYEASDYISSTMSKPYYSGTVVFVFPTDFFSRKIEEMPEVDFTEKEWEDIKRNLRENEEKFHKNFPDSVFYSIEGDHYSFAGESKMPYIVKLMHDNFD